MIEVGEQGFDEVDGGLNLRMGGREDEPWGVLILSGLPMY